MTVYYYNGDPIIVPFTVASNKPIFVSDTVSLKQVRLQQTAQRWELSFSTLSKENSADALLGILEDMDNRKQMVMPQLPEVDKLTTVSGVITVAATVTSDSSTITVSTNTVTGLLPKGSFVTFGSFDKLYIIKNDLNFDTANSTILVEVYPKLVNSIPSGSSLNFNNDAKISYYRDISNAQGITFSDGLLSNQGTITLIEAL